MKAIDSRKDQSPVHPESQRRVVANLSIPIVILVAVVLVLSVIAVYLGNTAKSATFERSPVALVGVRAEENVALCRSQFGHLPKDDGDVITVEQRAGWTHVLLKNKAACFMDTTVSKQRKQESLQVENFFGGEIAKTSVKDEPRRNAILVSDAGGGTFESPSRLPFVDQDDWFGWVHGRAGSEVVQIDVYLAGGQSVEASLADSFFSAWWIVDDVEGDDPSVAGELSLLVTLSDGQTIEIAGSELNVNPTN